MNNLQKAIVSKKKKIFRSNHPDVYLYHYVGTYKIGSCYQNTHTDDYLHTYVYVQRNRSNCIKSILLNIYNMRVLLKMFTKMLFYLVMYTSEYAYLNNLNTPTACWILFPVSLIRYPAKPPNNGHFGSPENWPLLEGVQPLFEGVLAFWSLWGIPFPKNKPLLEGVR